MVRWAAVSSKDKKEIRDKKWSDKQKDQGFIRRAYWLHKEDEQTIKEFISKLYENRKSDNG